MDSRATIKALESRTPKCHNTPNSSDKERAVQLLWTAEHRVIMGNGIADDLVTLEAEQPIVCLNIFQSENIIVKWHLISKKMTLFCETPCSEKLSYNFCNRELLSQSIFMSEVLDDLYTMLF